MDFGFETCLALPIDYQLREMQPRPRQPFTDLAPCARSIHPALTGFFRGREDSSSNISGGNCDWSEQNAKLLISTTEDRLTDKTMILRIAYIEFWKHQVYCENDLAAVKKTI